MISDIEELTCNQCNLHLGWVEVCDMNGNTIYCDTCYNKLLGTPVKEQT